jgi:adenosylmethionine-8-amino-7-oxononanoate aminotransferase
MASTLTQSLEGLDLAHSVHPNIGIEELNERGPVVFVEGHGVHLKDNQGREYLDARSGLTNCNLGYGNEEVARVAYEQMRGLHFVTSFGRDTSVPLIRLSEKIASLLPPELSRVVLVNSGSEANEVAFKTARFLNRLEGRPAKHKIIGRQYGYHGATLGTLPATQASGNFVEALSPLPPGYTQIPSPYCYRCPYDKQYPGCGIACGAEELERTILREGPDTVAAFVAEPIGRNQGILVPPTEYWADIREVCTKYNVLLIGDEVITGLGRTGKLWGFQHFGIWPDILTFGKGMGAGFFPICATVMREDLYQRLRRASPTGAWWGGFTNSGNPIGCSVALKVIEIVERDGLVENARLMGERLKAGLNDLRRLDIVGDVRGLGLFCAVELVSDRKTKAPLPKDKFRERRVIDVVTEQWLYLQTGGTIPTESIVMAPPLIVNAAEIDEMLARLGRGLELVQGIALG